MNPKEKFIKYINLRGGRYVPMIIQEPEDCLVVWSWSVDTANSQNRYELLHKTGFCEICILPVAHKKMVEPIDFFFIFHFESCKWWVAVVL